MGREPTLGYRRIIVGIGSFSRIVTKRAKFDVRAINVNVAIDTFLEISFTSLPIRTEGYENGNQNYDTGHVCNQDKAVGLSDAGSRHA